MKIFNEEKWNEFRAENMHLRFWQALLVFCDVEKIFFEIAENQLRDTFYIQDERD